MSVPVLSNLTYQTVKVTAPQNLGKSRFLNMSKNEVIMPDGSTVQPWQFWTKDGKVVEIDGLDSVKMWITKILKTDKFKFEAYKIAS